ncbi:MAG: LemA family protein [Candidatus Riflebacteria bacterium]|nr:LemA family protein [Candidatus Riflebacteria bacterium]
MSRIGGVIKKIYAKELELISNTSNSLVLVQKYKWSIRDWSLKRFADPRTLVISVVLIILVLALPLLGIVHFNRFKDCATVVAVRKADLEKELRRRDNLLPNIGRLVEKYSNYEEKMFNFVSTARESLGAAKLAGVASGSAAKELDKPLAGLMALAEQYPKLKAMQSTQVLIAGLIGSENRIAAAKEKYNNAAEDFNQLLSVFPGNIYGKLFGLKAVDYMGLDSPDGKIQSSDK